MDVIEINGTNPGPRMLITGGVHGDEFEPMVAIRRLAQCVAPSQLRGRLMLVPVVNAAAFARGARTAEDGLDLARTCPGRAEGSITEQTAAELAGLIRQADFYVDLHTGGTRFQLWPLAGYMLHSNPRVLEMQRKMAVAFNLPVIWGTSPELEGRSLSVARDAGVPAIYTEHGGGGGCRDVGVQDYVDGSLQILGLLGMLSVTTAAPRLRYIVEDSRPQSGHLQIQYPAAHDGYFEPSVQLGDAVEVGSRLGTVCDATGKRVTEVFSQQAGIVLLLASFPSVRAGETLAVILETELGAPQFPAELLRDRMCPGK